ncbi:MAG TPA: DEAD/DEAH box helicase [Prochlorococcus sp.]
MTNTKSHEDLSCSVETDAPQNRTATAEADLSSVLDETNDEDSGESSAANSADVIEDIETTPPVSEFEGFGFSEPLLNTLAAKGYKHPSPIQKAAFPELMLGRDLVGQAQTGTGKTAAFALPLLERLQDQGKRPQVLVLAPTRELAMQVADSFRAYAAGHPHLKVLAVYGGADFRSQINTLKRGVEVVVGTPGRVMDHMRQGTLDTSGLRCLVLDEADEMLRMGFIDDVEWILEQLPEERQMVLFSATMPSEIRRLSKRYLREPAEITIKSRDKESRLIRQRCITLQNSHKIEALKRVLEAVTGEGVIIFARTKVITLTVAESLEAAGHDVAVLNGDVPQNQRERTVERLRNGSVNILVATDVAARGLDVDRIGLVINYDIPFDGEAYVHRIGRTGRAGRNGEAILFVNPRERRLVGSFERAVGQPIEAMDIPNNAAINQSRCDRLRQRLTTAAKAERENSDETALLQELIQRVSQELELTPEQLALAALNLAVGPAPLLVKGDESWLQQSAQRSRRDDRRDSGRGGSGRRPERASRPPEDDMDRFRVEVGHRDRVKPGNLVGAIANESGLEGRMIGRIQIFDSYSLVDLPKGMPEDVFNDLKRLKVMNRELHIQRTT